MAEYLREERVREMLRASVRSAGTAKAWAEAHGIGPKHLSDVLRAKRGVSEPFATALGLHGERLYVRVGGVRRG